MDFTSSVNLLFLYLCAPVALLPYYHECAERGGTCVQSHQCLPESRLTSSLVQCPHSSVCCLGRPKRFDQSSPDGLLVQSMLPPHRIRHNKSISGYRPRVLYLMPKKLSTPSPSEWTYSVDQLEEDEYKIVNIQLMKNTLDDPTTFINIQPSPEEHNKEDVNSLEHSSEEEHLDRLQYLEDLYKKFATALKKHNSTDDVTTLTKRKLKYAVGHRSATHCKLYEKYSVEKKLHAVPLLPSPFPIMMQKNHCSKPLPLIVGGMEASKGEFPHMAALGYDRGAWIDFLCGGSLISEKYVLTAAHCGQTKWGPPIIVRLGTRNLITDAGQNMDVEEVIVHPDYHDPSCYNDIALIRIASGLQLSPSLRPACLPTLDTVAGDPGHFLTATGWGRVGYGLFSSPILRKVSLSVMDNQTCEEKFLGGRKSERLPSGIQNSMLCAAGHIDFTHDTCQGDSGGPLQKRITHSKCLFEIVGITSFGKLCGTGLPAIYTRVSSYIEWIEDIVWPS